LGRTCFSRTGVAGPGKNPGRRSDLSHAQQALEHDGHVLGFVAQIFSRCNGQWVHDACHGVLRSNDQTRLVFDAVIGQDGRGLRQLQHGEAVVALTDAQRNRFPRKPFLLLTFFKVFALPFLAGQDASHFPVDVDTRDLTKTQWFHEVMHGVYAQFIG